MKRGKKPNKKNYTTAEMISWLNKYRPQNDDWKLYADTYWGVIKEYLKRSEEADSKVKVLSGRAPELFLTWLN